MADFRLMKEVFEKAFCLFESGVGRWIERYLYVFILSLLIYIYVIGAKQFKADHETDLLKCLTKCFTHLYVIFYLQQYPQARLQSIINSFDAWNDSLHHETQTIPSAAGGDQNESLKKFWRITYLQALLLILSVFCQDNPTVLPYYWVPGSGEASPDW